MSPATRRPRAHDRRALGAFVKKERTDRNWTQSELAEKWGVTQAMISTVERGRTTVAYDRLQDLCAIFEIEPAEASARIEKIADEL